MFGLICIEIILLLITDSLEWAAKLGREKQALQLLNGPMMEYNFSHRDCDGLTVLHHASVNNMERLVQTIIQRLSRYFMSMDIADKLGDTPYIHAKRNGNETIAKELALAGASTHRADNSGAINNKHVNTVMSKELQLKIGGRLPQLKRLYESNLASKYEQCATLRPVDHKKGKTESQQIGASQNIMTDSVPDISSLLRLTKEGETVEKFIHSTKEDGETTTTGIESTNSLKNSNSDSMIDLSEIFTIASQQMTDSFCKPAVRPKPIVPIFNKIKQPKRSTLAAIMKKPSSSRPQRKQSKNRKISSKSDGGPETGSKFLPSIVA